MQYLHVDTEALRQAGRDISIACRETSDSVADLRSTEARLETAWQGNSAQAFLEEVRDVIAILTGRLELLDDLERILPRQAEAWEESDQRWGAAYRELQTLPAEEELLP